MSYTRSLVIVAFVAMIALILGCSGGGTPITPDKSPESLDSVPIIGLTDTNDTFNAIGLMGAYELYINPDDLSAELVNKRVSSIGEDYIVSGLAFFTVAPCADCLKIAGIGLVDGNLQLSFVISHPFKPGVSTEPPTARNRNDLDVFDLAMVIYPGGDPAPTATNYALTSADVYDGFCVGADGFTCELADVVDNDAALPYFLVIDDSTDADPPVSTWNKFAMGTVDSFFDVLFDMSAGSLRFDMYLTMGYGFSARRPDRLTPKYYNPEFNRKAAWKVVVTPPCGVDPPAMGNTWQDNDSTTPFDVTVDVYDWQIGATVATAEDFGDADPSEVFAASAPSGVSVEIPGMNTALQAATAPDVPTATGMPDDPWVYTLGIPNELGLVAGDYLGLAKVTDERPVLTPTDGRDFLIDTVDGVVLENYSMPEYATYQTFPATVVIGCGPITGSITSPACPVTSISDGSFIDFVVTAASANGGDPIVLYEVDTDYDGSAFTADASNTDGNFVAVGPFNNPNCGTPPEDPVTYTVAFRATDSCTPANETVFATCDVTVDICCSNESLLYEFTASIEGWVGGGCGLSNGDSWNYGHFEWCTASGSCFSGGALTTGGDTWGSGCDFLTDHGPNANYNVVSPSINLPTAADSTIEFNHCNAFGSGGQAYLYISLAGCTGPWTELWTTTIVSECISDESIDISSYTGTDVMFRFQYTCSNYRFDGGSCGNAGIVIDEVEIAGCFTGGSLHEN